MPIAGPTLEQPIILSRLLETGLRTKPDEPALVSLKGQWTWRDLDRASRRLAAHYLCLGLEPGDRVASLLPNRAALIVHYLACIRAALVATPLNYRYQAPEIDHALEVSGAAVMLAHAERDGDLAKSKLAGQLPLGRISFGADDLRQPSAREANARNPSLEEFLATEPAKHDLPAPPRPDAPVFIFFTSGSTGKPKGVTHTRESFGWIVASAIAGLGITPADVFLPATSASHIAASSFSLAGLAAGARVAIARSFGGDEVLGLLRSARPSLLCMLPTPLFGLVRDHSAAREDFHTIRRCVSGGDKIPSELEREFVEVAGFAIEELYGMTETGTSTFNPTGARNRIGSIGQVAPGYTASIRSDDGAEVPIGTPGRLWIQSLSNMVGYWNRPDATAETIVGGWLDTGDLVKADEQNYLWFRGRKKQIIVHDGSNICPQEVEDSLLENPAVASAGVVGIHDLIHGENVRAYVAFRPGVQRPTMPELIQFSRERVGYKAPDEITVLEPMPLNATGKVDRVALKQLANAQQHYLRSRRLHSH